jgi:uncharacterized cupin superfamily protein
MSTSIVVVAAASVDLDPVPIIPDWILSGDPQSRVKMLVKTKDRTSRIIAWDCTPGTFNWKYVEDEMVCVLSGEVFISTADGVERRLGTGDMAFFPAGSSCTWRVTERVRKVAFLRKDMPRVLGMAVRAWHILLRELGIRVQTAL